MTGPLRRRSFQSRFFAPISKKSAQASETPFDGILEHAPDAFLLHDLNGSILSANRAFCESLGYTPDELLGHSLAKIDTTYEVADFLSRHGAMVLGTASIRRAVHRRKDGSDLSVDARTSLVQEKPPLFLLVVRETVDRSEDTRQSNKMEALGRLAGGVAHDFNNLLTIILGYSDVILRQLGPEAAFREELLEVKRAGDRAAALTRQLLAFSRRQPSKPRVFDLGSVVKGLEGMLRRLIPESIQTEFAHVSEAICVKADQSQIDQVTMNLALNARDAMPLGGILRISTSVARVGVEVVAKHAGSSPGEYAVLSVADTGVGISKEQLPHLFEPFYTTKAQGKGTGLGLATVYGITKQSGGFLTVSSEPGKGSIFRVYLPRVKATPQLQSDSQVLPVFSRGERVLIVEDDVAVRTLVTQGLRTHGYKVEALALPEEAIRLVEEKAFVPELLLTDMVMPGMTGRELARELRLRLPRLSVVYMSGYSEEEAPRYGTLEPGAGFIAKPFLITDLMARVRKTLASAIAP